MTRHPVPVRERGFTLIEVMFALLLFATGLLALALCVPMASNKVTRSGVQTRASAIAADFAEELLTIPYGNSELTPGTHDDAGNPHDGTYYVRWLVEDDAPAPACKRITVRVARGGPGNLPEASVVIVTPRSGG